MYFQPFSVLGALLLSSFVFSQTIEDEFNNPCSSAKTCGECIQISSLCAWCGAEVFPKESPRCDMESNLLRNCDKKDITNPKTKYKINQDFAWTTGDQNNPPVQVKPQKMEFDVRPNVAMNFKLKFQQQANYPVDLYFLLDLSYGMYRQTEAQQRLIALGKDIRIIEYLTIGRGRFCQYASLEQMCQSNDCCSKCCFGRCGGLWRRKERPVGKHPVKCFEHTISMANITNNFRLGFGTFVDKVLMPYTAWTKQMLQDRCPIKERECRSPHDFMNRVNVGYNQSTFAISMEKALESISQSLDDAEGGLDGLIQALDCDVIGWRNVSRRIIVYSSNSLFHLAGAGKLGGATKHSDLKCNLTEDGEYEGENIYDYPSVSQIADKLRDKKANVIFAVMGGVAPYYQTLASFLDGAVVGELEADSKNIVGLIKNKYYELRSRIKFQAVNATNVDVVFKSECKGKTLKTTAICENLEIMDSVEFDVTMKARKDICEGQTGIVQKQVQLAAVGLNEHLLVTLNVRCECECEGALEEKTNSPICGNGNGTFECGICSCNPGRYGRECECDETEISSERSLELCRADRNDTLTCSGNGECVCGLCECLPIGDDPNQRYTGLYCDCNNYGCFKSKGESNALCGGSTHGICECGTCNCLPDWTGPACDCSTKTDNCEGSNGKVCNGTGTCKCNRCDCTATPGWFGPTCEDCLKCPSQCNEYVDCAQCKGFQTGTYNQEECDFSCNQHNITKIDNLPSGQGIRECEGTDVDKCKFFFTYEYSPKNQVIIKIQNTKDCPEDAPLAAIIGGTVAAVVLIPLLLICIIIFIRNMRDKEEYNKFMKEKEKARWQSDANPIYKDPTSTFKNPTYAGGKN